MIKYQKCIFFFQIGFLQWWPSVLYTYIHFLNDSFGIIITPPIKSNPPDILGCLLSWQRRSGPGQVEGTWGDTGPVTQMVKDDNKNVSVFTTGEETAMLETNQHAARLQRRWALLLLSQSESDTWSFWLVLQVHDTCRAPESLRTVAPFSSGSTQSKKEKN